MRLLTVYVDKNGALELTGPEDQILEPVADASLIPTEAPEWQMKVYEGSRSRYHFYIDIGGTMYCVWVEYDEATNNWNWGYCP